MCDCYENPMVRGTTTYPRARKIYRCDECLRNITPGEYYERTSGIWEESGGGTFRTCGDCTALRDKLNIDCYSFGMLVDHIDQRDGSDQKDFVERRRRNYDRIRKAKGRTQ